jgi:hypothetical protein
MEQRIMNPEASVELRRTMMLQLILAQLQRKTASSLLASQLLAVACRQRVHPWQQGTIYRLQAPYA